MRLQSLRHALLGDDKDVYDPAVFRRITVGALGAWIAMGGDLLGSCVYGPNVLARSSQTTRGVLLVVAVATLATLALLAYAYTRMVAAFPHGGGGYTAAKRVLGEPLALVSGIALVLDAAFNVAVSVVTCVDAMADALPGGFSAAKLPLALSLILLLTLLNLRGVKESIPFLVPILALFAGSHLLVLGLAVAHRADALPGVVAAVPDDVARLAADAGWTGALGRMARGYALSGAIYTGLESISNGVPILREPKIGTARRTMVLLAGVPAALIGAILLGYVLYDVGPEGNKTLNAVMFERAAAALGGGTWRRLLMVTLPLFSEAALLILAAQTGFVDGPRILGALATDRYLPRRLARLNGRLVPAPGVLLIAAAAFAATLIARGAIGPLLVVFVVSVFVTFTVSQLAMLRHAIRPDADRSVARVDATVHVVAFALCLTILGGTVVNSWRGSAFALAMITAGAALAAAIRRRYTTLEEAVKRLHERVVPQAAAAIGDPAPGGDPPDPADERVAVLLVGEHADFARYAMAWLAGMPAGPRRVILASVALIDAEAVQGEAHLREAEGQRRRALDELASDARRFGLPVDVEMRRGADVLETAVALVLDVLAGRAPGSVVIGFRSAPTTSPVDPLLRDELAVRLQARLQREKVAMAVVSVPLEA
jgi:amino acid transporter